MQKVMRVPGEGVGAHPGGAPHRLASPLAASIRRFPETRFSAQVPWTPSHHSRLHVGIWQAFAVSSLVFGVYYLHWRWSASLNMDALWLSLPLVIAETGAFGALILFIYNLWSPDERPPPPIPRVRGEITGGGDEDTGPITVDVFFATYNEEVELVRAGIRDARRLDYPYPIDVRIHLLDDGRRPAMEAMAAEEGAGYITRSDNAGFKAGNMRNAMMVTSGELIVICDADTRLFPNFLTETVGYFRDPQVAWVQTPQWFWDIPPGVPLSAWLGRRAGAAGRLAGRLIEGLFGPIRIGEDPFGNDPQLFYDFILRRRNTANAAFCCGAASIHRRDALMEAAIREWVEEVEERRQSIDRGIRQMTRERDLSPEVAGISRMDAMSSVTFSPFKLHVSEDIYTSLALHADPVRRWISVQHPVVVSAMMSPRDMLSWTIQRYKYAGGTLDILRRDSHLLRSGLSLRQKLMYAATYVAYLSPLWNLVFIFVPIVFLFSGVAPVETYSLEFLLHAVPFLLLNELAQLTGLWGANTMQGRRWQVAMFPLLIRAGWTVLRGRRISFTVTPKERNAQRHVYLVRWQIALSVLTLAALAAGWTQFLMGAEAFTFAAILVNTLWAANNLASLSLPIRAAAWRPDPEFDLPVMECHPDDR